MSTIDDLKGRIEQNPLDYDAYRELIDILPSGEEKHLIRKQFHLNFPLDENTWIAWLNDISAKDSSISFEEQTKLFEEGIQDYLSPRLYVLRCQHLWNIFRDEEKTRQAFREAAAKCGAHFTQGHIVWNAWIDFETQVENGKQIEYPLRRRATSPILEVSRYWNEYCTRFPSEVTSNHKAMYDTAEQTCKERLANGEENIAKIRGEGVQENAGSPTTAVNTELENEWFLYIEREKKQHPKRKPVILYERALGDSCLSERIWIKYIEDLLVSSSTEEELRHLKSVSGRSVRNITASTDLWGLYLRSQYLLDSTNWEISIEKVKAALKDTAAIARCYIIHLGHVLKRSTFADFLVEFNKSVQTVDSIYQLCPEEMNRNYICELMLFGTRGISEQMVVSTEEKFLEIFDRTWDALHKYRPKSGYYWTEHLRQLDLLFLKGRFEQDYYQKQKKDMMVKALQHLSTASNPEAYEWMSEMLLHYSNINEDEDDVIKSKWTVETKRKSISATTASVVQPSVRKNKRAMESSIEVHPESGKRPRVALEGQDVAAEPKRNNVEEEGDDGEKTSTTLAARRIRSTSSKYQNNILFIETLPATATEHSLISFLLDRLNHLIVSVKGVRLSTRKNLIKASTGEKLTKQYAFVELTGRDRVEACEFCISEISGKEWDGCVVKIYRSEPPKRNSGNDQTQTNANKHAYRSGSQSGSAANDHTGPSKSGNSNVMDVLEPSGASTSTAGAKPTSSNIQQAELTTKPKPKMLMIPRALAVAKKS
jgi:hypothetical protein